MSLMSRGNDDVDALSTLRSGNVCSIDKKCYYRLVVPANGVWASTGTQRLGRGLIPIRTISRDSY